MMFTLKLPVAGIHAWSPDRLSMSAWRAWAGDGTSEAFGEPGLPILPMMLRRRVSAIGQKALGAAMATGLAERSRYVFASRHGDLARTVTLLDALAREATLSPADFSVSVHHALAGLLSIALANRCGHSAVAAGTESFALGLVEAGACAADNPGEPVLLIYWDEPLPGAFGSFAEATDAVQPLIVVVALDGASSIAKRIEFSFAPADAPGRSPQSLAMDFVKFFCSGAAEATSEGERMRWRWCRAE